MGLLVSGEPIGLLGGFNPYGYVGIPTAWVDPLGLSRYDGVKYDTPEARKIAQRENDKIAKNQNNKKC